jgi:hypothetical protein
MSVAQKELCFSAEFPEASLASVYRNLAIAMEQALENGIWYAGFCNNILALCRGDA